MRPIDKSFDDEDDDDDESMDYPEIEVNQEEEDDYQNSFNKEGARKGGATTKEESCSIGGPSYVDTSEWNYRQQMPPKMKHMQGSGSVNQLQQDRELNSKKQSKPQSANESKLQSNRDEIKRKNYISPRPQREEMKGMKVIVKSGKNEDI